MHLYVARTDISFVALVLNAMIMRLLSVVLTEAELNCTIVHGSEAEKSSEDFSLKFVQENRLNINHYP